MGSAPAPAAYHLLFGASATARPDHPALVLDDGTIWSYSELEERAASLAGSLVDHGVDAGDRVAVQVDKSADAVALYLACLRRGIVYLPLNVAYTPDEVGYFVDDAAVSLVIARPGSDLAHHDAGSRRPMLTLGPDGDGTLAVAADGRPPAPPVPRELGELAALLYTSGTTGRAKGAMLSGTNLVANARALIDAWRFSPDDVLVHVLPIFHVHGLFVALHCAFGVGATVRFHRRFDVAATRTALHGATAFMGVPTHYHRLLADRDFGAPDCASMRLFTSGSAPLAAERHREFSSRTGFDIVERYGMTETMILTSNPVGDGPDGRGAVAGTVGFALPGVDVRIVDDDGEPVTPGHTGTVEVRGEGVCLGYWGRPDLAVGSGWFSTGDIGSFDATGRLTLAGRASDMIISGGLNIYPAEVERVLDAADGVEEAAVIGVPDEDLGEAVVAVIVPDDEMSPPEPDTLHTACEVLARFKRPRRYEFVADLPRNAMGKVQKAHLRTQFGR